MNAVNSKVSVIHARFQCANAPTAASAAATMVNSTTLKVTMKLSRLVKNVLLSVTLVTSLGVHAQVRFSINVGPPPPIYEPVPMMQPGYAWAPGYWAWNNDRHIWVRGRSMVQRTGYRWEPDRWDQRGNGYYRQPGNWVRDGQYVPIPPMKAQKWKKPRPMPHQGPWDDQPGKGPRR